GDGTSDTHPKANMEYRCQRDRPVGRTLGRMQLGSQPWPDPGKSRIASSGTPLFGRADASTRRTALLIAAARAHVNALNNALPTKFPSIVDPGPWIVRTVAETDHFGPPRRRVVHGKALFDWPLANLLVDQAIAGDFRTLHHD